MTLRTPRPDQAGPTNKTAKNVAEMARGLTAAYFRDLYVPWRRAGGKNISYCVKEYEARYFHGDKALYRRQKPYSVEEPRVNSPLV